MTEKQKAQTNDVSTSRKRSPIVVVLGHVDHGKSSLLQYVRQTEMLRKEAGGITQATGAYEIEHNKERITFIDTPGHAAFSKMRSRGAHVADLAILVVAADDGVKPQTKESIQTLCETKTPFVVAINKIDKNNADVERVKRELTESGVLLEGMGGDVSFELISAKTGEGVNKLLDLVLLVSEFIDLTYNTNTPASGVVIEAKLDKSRGNEVTAIVKNGVLKKGGKIFTRTAQGKIKALQNFLREGVEELRPSSPALILGFGELPAVGEEFVIDETSTINFESLTPSSKEHRDTKPQMISSKSDVENLLIILKADTAGSLEAVSQVLRALQIEGVGIRIFSEGIGIVTDSDVKDANVAGAVVVGFNTRAHKSAEILAQNQGVKIVTSNIIYDLVKKVEEELRYIKTPPPLGTLEVLKLFSAKGSKQLIGGRVLGGEFRNKTHADVIRGDSKIGEGKILSLKIQKQDVSLVEMGKECGVVIESSTTVEVGDKIVIAAPTR